MLVRHLCIFISDEITLSKMSAEYFYHYTSKRAAELIILEGKILPSLEANGDAIHGDGVYLTTLEPGYGEETIKNNNWDGVGKIMTDIEAFFEILIPSSKVVRANDTRDIQVHKGPLPLCDYKWSLKNWDGDLLATQYFMVSSEGRAKEHQGGCMGRYTIVRDVLTRQEDDSCFVYKKDEDQGEWCKYLYNYDGDWLIGDIAGGSLCLLQQSNDDDGRTQYSPFKNKPWLYFDGTDWLDGDKTLKVFPCYF